MPDEVPAEVEKVVRTGKKKLSIEQAMARIPDPSNLYQASTFDPRKPNKIFEILVALILLLTRCGLTKRLYSISTFNSRPKAADPRTIQKIYCQRAHSTPR